MRTTRPLYLTDNPNTGASARVLLDWVRRQSDEHLEFHFALATAGPLADWLTTQGTPHVLCPMPWPMVRNAWPLLQSLRRLRRYCRQHQIDLLHAEHNVYPFAAVLGRMLGLPVICHVHYLVDRPFAEWAFTGWRAPAHVLWTSHAQREECRDAVAGIVTAERQSVVYLGVSLDTFGTRVEARNQVRQQWGVPSSTVVVGAANAIRPRKRVEDFLRLIDRLTREHPDVIGVLAGAPQPGDEAYEAQMRLLAASLQLDGRLLWLGNVDPIEPFLQGIDIFVSTSAHETFGMSICEAMACGRPVVTYQAGSAGEVVGEGGHVVPTADLSSLHGAVDALVVDRDLRCELGSKGRVRVGDSFNPRRSLGDLARRYSALGDAVHSTGGQR